MLRALGFAALVVSACSWSSVGMAQSGAITKPSAATRSTDAAKEAPTTRKNGKPLTFAIITHTAGNGFFDPVYVGAQVAAQRLRDQPDQARLRSADGRHPARNPDPQPDRQRSDDQRRDHDHPAGRRLQRHRQEARGPRRRRRHDQLVRPHDLRPSATSATPARTPRRRRSAARRS